MPVPLAPNGRLARSHGWCGNVVLVRAAEIEDVRTIRLPGLEPRGAVMIDLSRDGGKLRVIATHLGLLHASRLAQVHVLVAALDAAEAGRDDRPTILMGDLNEWRLRKRSSLDPLAVRKPETHAPVASFPARMPMLALDRIMGSATTRITDFQAHDTPLSRAASDHLPVKARLALPFAITEHAGVVKRAGGRR